MSLEQKEFVKSSIGVRMKQMQEKHQRMQLTQAILPSPKNKQHNGFKNNQDVHEDDYPEEPVAVPPPAPMQDEISAGLDELNMRTAKAAPIQHDFLSMDILRSKQYDSSSKQMPQSQLIKTYGIPSVHQKFNREEYCAPIDRVGRFYTPSAAGLSMKKAEKVAKQMTRATTVPKKVIGFALAATAPDALRAGARIAESLETGMMPHKTKKTATVISLPSSASPLSLREGHRLLRSEPEYGTLKANPLPHVPEGFEETGFSAFRDLDDWDPDPVQGDKADNDEKDNTEETSGHTVGDGTRGSRHRPILESLLLKAKATERFAVAVDIILRMGVVTSGGSGHRAPIPSMNHESLNSIIARVPSLPSFLDDGFMQHLLGRELSYVQDEYFKAAARACVEYDLKDGQEAATLGINVKDLHDESPLELWINRQYLFPEWRVLRQTEVSSRKVLRTYRVIDRSLRVNLQVMQVLSAYNTHHILSYPPRSHFLSTYPNTPSHTV